MVSDRALLAYEQMKADPEAWVAHGYRPEAPAGADVEAVPQASGHVGDAGREPAMAVLRNPPGALDWRRYYTKGFLSNTATFCVMLAGAVMRAFADDESLPMAEATRGALEDMSRWVLSFGVFGFAGGITNWLAVKMLFDRVPGLYGSGVIPLRFREIREAVKDTMLRTFFDREYLERYLSAKLEALADGPDLAPALDRALSAPEVEEVVERNLEGLKARPEGLLLAIQGVDPVSLKPVVMTFLRSAGRDLGPVLVRALEPGHVISVDRVRAEVDLLMTTKMEELTPERVRSVMEEVIRVHLGWLIVWGNVFGGCIGLVSAALGYP